VHMCKLRDPASRGCVYAWMYARKDSRMVVDQS